MKKRLFPVLFSLLLLCGSVPAVADAADPVSRMFFFGESTTSHLALRGGIDPSHVWANPSGTMKLDSGILSRPLVDHATGRVCTVSELAAAYRPEFLVLSFGLNGVMVYSEKPDLFLRNYRRLIDAVRAVSPETRIIIQSVCPVACASCQSDWHFSVSPEEINRRLASLNACLLSFCRADPSLLYIDTASALTDASGFLRSDLTTDGIHLNASAYRLLLDELRKGVRR